MGIGHQLIRTSVEHFESRYDGHNAADMPAGGGIFHFAASERKTGQGSFNAASLRGNAIESRLRRLFRPCKFATGGRSAPTEIPSSSSRRVISAEAERALPYRAADDNRSLPTAEGKYMTQHRDRGTSARARIAPHPLFDPEWYRRTNPDLAPHEVSFGHYVLQGWRRLSSPHPLFSVEHYLAQRPDVAEAGIEPLAHYVTQGWREGANPHLLFDTKYYLSQCANMNGADPLTHYVTVGWAAGLKPNPFFDPLWYRNNLPPDEVQTEPLGHYVQIGCHRKYPPYAGFGGNRSDVDVFADFLARAGIDVPLTATSSGQTGEFARAPNADVHSFDDGVRSYRAIREKAQALRHERIAAFVEKSHEPGPLDISSLRFRREDDPVVTILIPVYNEYEHTLECLASIGGAGEVACEVILADDASTDPRMGDFSKIENLRIVRSDVNQGFLRNCNGAFAHARGRYLFLLNNDAVLGPGALDVLVQTLESRPHVGAAGPMILYPNGRLQEAGCHVNLDGSTTMVGLFEDSSRAEFNWAREVDYCSGAALLLRRELIDILFDEKFAPAYYEDVDLCFRIRKDGWRICYQPAAKVVHHLSVSNNRNSERNRVRGALTRQQVFFEKWKERLSDLNRLRVIAFYLPQFHPIPENDLAWGRGFTEWTNVTSAKPSYIGQDQPHLPTDLGFYDLRLTEIMGEQYRLARRYGIEGFCVYYYNFSGKRILDAPMERLLQRPDVDFRFCLCWANENWTKHWDGGARDILLAQDYSRASLETVASDAVRFARDPRQITIEGRPLFLVYRPKLIPNIDEMTRMVRENFERAGFPGVYLAYVESMETATLGLRPEDIGFDASVQFPPHGVGVEETSPVVPLKENWAGKRYSYVDTIINDVAGGAKPYKSFPAAFAGWDNTPRQPLLAHSFDGARPEVFQFYLESKFEQAKSMLHGEERLVFINAWNEWAEGAHLEPDRSWGHRWLEAVRNALSTASQVH